MFHKRHSEVERDFSEVRIADGGDLAWAVEARTKICVSMRANKEGLDFHVGLLLMHSRF